MTPLWKRVLAEKRAVVLPLAVGLVLNILAYAFVVYPLGVNATGSAERAATAASAKQAAARDEALARALVTGKAKADEELTAFYDKVLPPDQTAARRMTFVPMAALAAKTNVRLQQIHIASEEKPKDLRDRETGGDTPADLGRLTERLIVEGAYRDVRSFIYQLETAPAFVIIDSVTLLEGEPNAPQRVTFELSTYFRLKPNGI